MSVLDELVTGAVEDQQAREQKIPLDEVKRQPLPHQRLLMRGNG